MAVQADSRLCLFIPFHCMHGAHNHHSFCPLLPSSYPSYCSIRSCPRTLQEQQGDHLVHGTCRWVESTTSSAGSLTWPRGTVRWLGEVDAVVVSFPGVAAQVVASRSSLFATEIICYGNRDISFAPYGGYWWAPRRVCTQELLGARKVRKFAALAEAVASSLISEINATASAGGGAVLVNLNKLLLSCTNTITVRAMVGDYCSWCTTSGVGGGHEVQLWVLRR